jgi:nucleoside-diphosphate-sugar epimerase
MSAASHEIFITGGTGYLGRHLIPRLLERGYRVRALVREESRSKLPAGCELIVGNVLDSQTYGEIAPAETFVHLVGTSRPSPLKADEFRKVDLASVEMAVAAAVAANVRHFVYVSVAQPAPVMRAYVTVRAECERLIRDRGLNVTILRPWYILGPGHWWPYVLIPFYKLAENFPPTAESSKRLGLVKLSQMVAALLDTIQNPARGVRIIEVPKIRRFGRVEQFAGERKSQ